MRLITTIATLALLSVPASALAQIDLTWNNCVLANAGEPQPAKDQVFDCTSFHFYQLHGSFKVPVAMPSFVGMDIEIDLQWVMSKLPYPRLEPLPPFWHFEPGGCNSSGISVSADKSSSGDGTAGGACGLFTSPWGPHGEAVTWAGVAAYAADYQYPGRGRMIVAIVRAANDPVVLQPQVNYYAFHLLWSTQNADGCQGCEEPFVAIWNRATLYQNEPEPAVVLSGPDKAYPFYAGINGGDYNIPDPVVPATWGQIKSQYR